MDTTKICIDCISFRRNPAWPESMPRARVEDGLCVRRVIGWNMVTGDKTYALCREERESASPLRCGEEARHFMPKQAPPL